MIKKISCRYSIIVFLFFLRITYCQTPILDKKYSIVFNNILLHDAIKILNERYSINFSWNAKIFPDNVRITEIIENQPLRHILEEILIGQSIGYMEINNQIVLYKMNVGNEDKKKTKVDTGQYEKNEQVLPKSNVVYDTIKIQVIDTTHLIITDTVHIQVMDTTNFIMTDTVKIYKTIQIPKTQNIEKTNTNSKFKMSLSLTPLLSACFYNIEKKIAMDTTFNLIKNSIQNGVKYGVELTVNLRINNFQLQTGIGYYTYQLKYNHSTQESGGYFRTDTIDRYYSGISGSDTNWIYVTEEKWIETLTYLNINSTQKFNYVEIPVILGYAFSKKQLTLSINAGIYWQYLINNSADLLFTNLELGEEKVSYKKSSFSFYASYASVFYFTNRLSFILEGFYKQGLSSIIDDSYKYKFNMYTFGIKFGFQYTIL